jgi:hypothetical protein
MAKIWKKPAFTHILIFNVNRGLSVFIRNPLNNGMIYDLGSSEEFSPIQWLKENVYPSLSQYESFKIAQLVLSHPHSDHISEVEKISNPETSIGLVTCPHDKTDDEKIDWNRINNQDSAKYLIEGYQKLIEGRSPPLQTIKYSNGKKIPNCEYGLYYVRPPEVARIEPKNDQEYSNGISIVMYYRHGKASIIIPGDVSPASFEAILDGSTKVEKRSTEFYSNNQFQFFDKTLNQMSLGEKLRMNGLTFYLTSHHGLESGFCKKLYEYIKGNKVNLHLISEKRHTGKNDGKIHANYSSDDYATGLPIINMDDENRETVNKQYSTANGKSILLVFDGTGTPKIYASKDVNLFKSVMFEE